MKYDKAEDVKHELKIDEWESVSPDAIQQVSSMWNEISPAAQGEIFQALRNPAELCLTLINSNSKDHAASLASNEVSQDHFYRAASEEREVFKMMLAQETMTSEEKKHLLDLYRQNVESVSAKDTETKSYLKSMATKTAAVATVVFVGAMALAVSALKSIRPK